MRVDKAPRPNYFQKVRRQYCLDPKLNSEYSPSERAPHLASALTVTGGLKAQET